MPAIIHSSQKPKGKANWSTAVLEISLGGDKVKYFFYNLYFYFDLRI
jgi:hypothetical protein